MNKVLKRILISVGIVIGVIALVLGGFIGYAYATDYRPDQETVLKVDQASQKETLNIGSEYTMITFNIGYGGLGEQQDFFMDGGSKSGADSLEEVNENLNAVQTYLTQTDPDFAFLQEVDLSGKRSFNVNQYEILRESMRFGSFAYNYKVKYVPVPFTNPQGGVESGIVTLSKAEPYEATRYSFDGQEMAIQQLFDLKRAFTISRFKIDGSDKELVLINAHFSAFDKGGKVRKQQVKQMQTVLETESKHGNYIILGGDFNHELPGTSADNFAWTEAIPSWVMQLPLDFAPKGYNWAVDPQNPTVRAVEAAYVDGYTYKAVIDGFLVSDNIEILHVEGQGTMNFKNSDHNPVQLHFKLK
ncbi:endonuclease [Erysipelothrix sp. HDW6C]|uniref:endonuclease/exonuclease/phosphatase family protein n=1 Tax=Erysipelothrix sp. HDW6C TaxID=2714930 RepID=UPI0014097C87|nr:endonuclease/exonuclease/phosphatase family protein [Erysipelothrix sp. HDW6C]QIK70066.1 endonuclease [Erysipelothrix sp. HDW6C]